MVVCQNGGKGSAKFEDVEDKISNQVESSKACAWREILVAVGACLVNCSHGLLVAYTATALPSMSNDPDLGISEYEGSWIASAGHLGGTVGAITSGPVMKFLGRKSALIYYCTLPSFINWISIIMAKHLLPVIGQAYAILLIIFGRGIGGICMGSAMTVVPVYILETMTPQLRERVGPFPQLLRAVFYMISLIMGTYLDWYQCSVVCVITLIPVFLIQLQLPESPVWLVVFKKDMKSAERSLKKLRGATCSIENELHLLAQQSGRSTTDDSSKPEQEESIESWKKLCKPFAIAIFMMITNQGSGNTLFNVYRVIVLHEIDGSIDPYAWSILLALIAVICPIVTVCLTKWYSSKFILLWSSVIFTIALYVLGIYMRLVETGIDCELKWIPLVSLVVYSVFSGIGFGSVLYSVTAAVLPLRSRDIGNAAAVTTAWLIGFIVTKLFYDMKNAIQLSGTFLFYAIWSTLGLVFIAKCIPNNLAKGKRLSAISAL